MIRVVKPNAAPAILRNRGTTTTDANNADFDAAPNAFRDGTRRFRFASKLYGAKSVKNPLIKAQHGKCAFCESKIIHVAFGDVEHYRTKGGVRQSEDEPMALPGYYWLAYVWENLFLACTLYNQRFKKNLFPLADPTLRARSHHDDVSAEAPLFIDPARDAPEEFIGFREEVIFAIDDNPRGRATIKALGLDRSELEEERRRLCKILRSLHNLVQLSVSRGEGPSEDVLEAQSLLEAAVANDSPYASMVRCLLRRGP